MPEDQFTALQQQVSDLSDAVDALNYGAWKKSGPGTGGISGAIIQSLNYIKGIAGWALTPDGNLEANNGNFRGDITGATGTIGGFTLGADFLRDLANSMGLASTVTGGDDVRFWAGDTFANRATAPFHVTEAGAAYCTNIKMGGASVQYVINDNGYFSYGDGSDGSLTTSGDVTLTSDKYYTDLTISTGNTFKPNGWRIFVSGTLTINGTGKISGDGNAGGVGAGGNGAGYYSANAGGAAGAALADGYLKGSLAGVAGGAGQTSASGVGNNGSNTTNSIGANANNGSGGGAGGNGQGGSFSGNSGAGGGSGGTVTASNVKLIANWHLATLLDISSTGSTVKFDNSASAGSGGGGGGSGQGPFINPYQGRICSGGGGGGSGSSGRIVAIYARNIVIGASASITANGGNGGNGGAGGPGENQNGVTASGGSGGGGGGAGGNGGVLVLAYNTLTNNGTISAAYGPGGTGGTGGASGGSTAQAGTNGTNGSNGAAGSVKQFPLSL